MKIVLAPMEGVVDWAMRDVITRIGGVDLCVTEFLRVTDRLHPASEFYKNCPELKTKGQTASGIPVFLQLLGGQPAPVADNAALAAELGAPGIDLNFGCPAKTVNRHDGGAVLLKNPHRIHDIVSEVRKSVPTSIPVTAKVRLGFSCKSQSIEIAQAAAAGGAHWLTVHARTRDEGYRPPAHWEYIARMRESIHIPVIANGEIWSISDYKKCREISGCEDVMIGRGLLAQPDLALQIKTLAESFAWPKALSCVVELTQKSRDFRGESYAVSRYKQWAKQLTRNFPEAHALFEDTKRLSDYTEILDRLKKSTA